MQCVLRLIRLACVAALLASLVVAPLPASAVVASIWINEIRIDQPGVDYDEYFELQAGPTNIWLGDLTFVVVGDSSATNSGIIEKIVPLSDATLTAGDYWFAGIDSCDLGTPDQTFGAGNAFENGQNSTFFLVRGFSGALLQDLDTDDNGTLDSTPWTTELSRVAVIEEQNPPATTVYHYGPPTVGPATGATHMPFHAVRMSSGTWAFPSNTFVEGIADTPGAQNNLPPVAAQDSYTVAEDETLTVDVADGLLANDSDAESNTITLAHYTGTLHGTLTDIGYSGAFIYRPHANWQGTETFTYNVTDGTAESEWTTVTINVTPVADAPVAVDDTATVAEDTTLTVGAPGLLANDSDVDSDTITLQSWYGPGHGTVVAQADGAWTYRPVDDWIGTDSFSYVISDGHGGTATGTVTITVTNVADVTEFTQIAGGDRFATCVQASQGAFAAAGTVVIATGRNWPDALGGSSLAGAYGGPILLVEPGDVPNSIATEIQRLGAERAIIIGGTGAVGTAVETELAGLLTGSKEVTRVAGLNRYQTARLVAEATIDKTNEGSGAWDGTFFVATGGNYPDALGAAPAAHINAWPIVLSDPSAGLHAETLASLQGRGASRAYLLGGIGAVPEYVTTQLASVQVTDTTRFAGANRYDTAAQVASMSVAAWGLNWNGVAIATGQNYADALAGGPAQGNTGSVMLLTTTLSLNPYTETALIAHKDEITRLSFLGGDGAVSPTVRNAVDAVLW